MISLEDYYRTLENWKFSFGLPANCGSVLVEYQGEFVAVVTCTLGNISSRHEPNFNKSEGRMYKDN